MSRRSHTPETGSMGIMDVTTPSQAALFTTTMVRSENSSGTAFVFSVESKGRRYPILVSNKHVALAPGRATFSMFPGREGKPVLGEKVVFAYNNPQTHWVGHPSPDVDVAAMFVAPLINMAEEEGISVFYRSVTSDIFPKEDSIRDLDAIEPVTFIGYPNALHDEVNFTPIARRGFTATPLALNHNGLPAFLIDASVFPGSSGSPVFIINDNGYYKGSDFILGSRRILFVGILAAVHVQQDRGILVTRISSRVHFNQMLDLGIVFNWRAVSETVDALFKEKGVSLGDNYEPANSVDDLDVRREAAT